MDVGLAIAGVLCVGLALGHTAVGFFWVLPGLDKERLPSTPFGPPSATDAMVRVTWYIVTVFVLALGGLLLTLAWAPAAEAKTLLLRWFAVMWLAATALALVVTRRGLRTLLRVPVWTLWLVVAALCWAAST